MRVKINYKRLGLTLLGLILVIFLASRACGGSSVPKKTTSTDLQRAIDKTLNQKSKPAAPKDAAAKAEKQAQKTKADEAKKVGDEVLQSITSQSTVKVEINDTNPGTFYAEYNRSPRSLYFYRVGPKTNVLQVIYDSTGAWVYKKTCWKQLKATAAVIPRSVIPVLNTTVSPRFVGVDSDVLTVEGKLKGQGTFTAAVTFNEQHLPTSYVLNTGGGATAEGTITYPSAATQVPNISPQCEAKKQPQKKSKKKKK